MNIINKAIVFGFDFLKGFHTHNVMKDPKTEFGITTCKAKLLALLN